MPRFAILRHLPGPRLGRTPEVHLDWLFECGDVLSTWSSPVSSQIRDWIDGKIETIEVTLPVTPLADHRRLYLDFEGELSKNRGRVERIGRGIYFPTPKAVTPNHMTPGIATPEQRRNSTPGDARQSDAHAERLQLDFDDRGKLRRTAVAEFSNSRLSHGYTPGTPARSELRQTNSAGVARAHNDDVWRLRFASIKSALR